MFSQVWDRTEDSPLTLTDKNRWQFERVNPDSWGQNLELQVRANFIQVLIL